MEEVKIRIGDKRFQVEVAYTDEEKEKGLSNRESLDPDKGMLFVWDEPETVSMWMKDTKIPLDLIFIDGELIVTAIHQGVPDSENILEEDNIAFVLELNVNSGIKVGDELEFSPEKVVKSKMMTAESNVDYSNPDKMMVLNEDGKTQMELTGGERIMSRVSTKVLIRKAKKAASLQTDSTYKSLGKYLFKELSAQNSRDPEYVTQK